MRRKNLKKASTKGRDVRFATETLEERGERIRINKDISKLRHIFAPGGSTVTEGQKGKTQEGDEERLILLQFPPITPFLIDPSAPLAPIDDDEVMEVKQEGNTTSASANAQQPTSSTSKAAVKKDPDTAPTAKAAARVQSSAD
ncbi:MAG: hypothetical protein M1823_008163, partial [Watsoniomyces obsoletus]